LEFVSLIKEDSNRYNNIVLLECKYYAITI